MQIFVQVCRALKEVHSENVIHRDFNPDNIYIFPNDIVKVGGFGQAKKVSDPLKINKTLAGLPTHMAPEIFDKDHSFEVDIWALGVLLFQL